MEMIVISKRIFDSAFDVCLDKLSLRTLEETKHYRDLNDLHRKFYYEIANLKEQLEKG